MGRRVGAGWAGATLSPRLTANPSAYPLSRAREDGQPRTKLLTIADLKHPGRTFTVPLSRCLPNFQPHAGERPCARRQQQGAEEA